MRSIRMLLVMLVAAMFGTLPALAQKPTGDPDLRKLPGKDW